MAAVLAAATGITPLSIDQTVLRSSGAGRESALAAALMGLAVATLDGWLELQGLNSLVRLFAGIPAGVLVYAGLIALLDRRDSLSLLQRVRRR